MRERAGFYNSDSEDEPEMNEIRRTARKSVPSYRSMCKPGLLARSDRT